MTTFTIKTNKGLDTNSALPLNQSQIILQNQTNWVVQDSVTGDKYFFLGSDFTYNANGLITSGLVTKVSQLDATGKGIATAQFSQGYDVAKLGYPKTYADLLLGDDLIVGGAGNDTLGGGNGVDGNGVYHYNGHSYLLSNAGTWTDAEAQAVSLGGHLVTVNDQAENNWLVSTFKNVVQDKDGIMLWIGYTDQQNEGTFKWISGENSSYTNWYSGEPNNYPPVGGEDFSEMIFRSDAYGLWNDLPNSMVELGYSPVQGIIELNSLDSGNDTFKGGKGNDTYFVDSMGDVVKELAGEGTDTVNSAITYTLPANVENLTLTSTSAIDGTGNGRDNVITGNAANNVLNGGAGSDTAVYSGAASDYKIEYLRNGSFKITDTNLNDGRNDGVDTLTGIEKLQFSDKSFALDGKTIPVSAIADMPGHGADYLRALQLNDSTQSTVTIWRDTTIKYYFDKHDDTLAWTDTGFWTGAKYDKQAVALIQKALSYYSAITPLNFMRTDNPQKATFKFNLVSQDWMNTNVGDALGMMIGPTGYPDPQFLPNASWGREAGTMILKESSSWTQGERPFSTIVHELGHGFGLQHSHYDYVIFGQPTPSNDLYFPGVDTTNRFTLGTHDLNQGVYTVMSYNRTTGDNANIIDGTPATPMALDIAALQALYGSDSYRTEANNYTLTDTSTDWVCIWDTGGTDSIVYNGSKATQIDLRAATITPDVVVTDATIGGYLSKVSGVGGGYTIAHGVEIENAKGGKGSDVITGNDIANTLEGNAGTDTLNGLDGNDALYGGNGKDTLYGGNNNDVLDGGAGQDTLYGEAENDTFSFWTTADANGDKVMDFQLGIDKIDLSKIDALADTFLFPSWAGKQSFDYSKTNDAGTRGGFLFFDDTSHSLKGWVDLGSTADFSITLTGITKAQLDATAVSDWLIA